MQTVYKVAKNSADKTTKASDTRNRNWYQKLARGSVNLVPDSGTH